MIVFNLITVLVNLHLVILSVNMPVGVVLLMNAIISLITHCMSKYCTPLSVVCELVYYMYTKVHSHSTVIHILYSNNFTCCGLWNMPPYRPSVGSYLCISGCEYFEV